MTEQEDQTSSDIVNGSDEGNAGPSRQPLHSFLDDTNYHKQLIDAIMRIGIDKASPRTLLQHMLTKNEQLTTERLKSKLQRVRKDPDREIASVLEDFDSFFRKIQQMKAIAAPLARSTDSDGDSTSVSRPTVESRAFLRVQRRPSSTKRNADEDNSIAASPEPMRPTPREIPRPGNTLASLASTIMEEEQIAATATSAGKKMIAAQNTSPSSEVDSLFNEDAFGQLSFEYDLNGQSFARIPLPKLTEDESASPLGQSLLLTCRLLSQMQHTVEESRLGKERIYWKNYRNMAHTGPPSMNDKILQDGQGSIAMKSMFIEKSLDQADAPQIGTQTKVDSFLKNSIHASRTLRDKQQSSSATSRLARKRPFSETSSPLVEARTNPSETDFAMGDDDLVVDDDDEDTFLESDLTTGRSLERNLTNGRELGSNDERISSNPQARSINNLGQPLGDFGTKSIHPLDGQSDDQQSLSMGDNVVARDFVSNTQEYESATSGFVGDGEDVASAFVPPSRSF